MDSLRHQNYKNKTTETKNGWHDWLINYILELVKKRWVVLKTKLHAFLKQTHPRIIANQQRSNHVWRSEKTDKSEIKKSNQKTK